MTGFKTILLAMLVLITIICNGCKTTAINWPEPPKPQKHPVIFVPTNNGLWLDKTSSENLLKNVKEMDAYTKKMETLVEHMKKHYGDK